MIIELDVFMEFTHFKCGMGCIPSRIIVAVVLDMMVLTVEVEEERNKSSQERRCIILVPSNGAT
jgi:hypothetical protein